MYVCAYIINFIIVCEYASVVYVSLVCVHGYVYGHFFAYMCIWCVHVYGYVYVLVCMCVYYYVCTYTRMYNTHTHTHTRTYIHTDVHIQCLLYLCSASYQHD